MSDRKKCPRKKCHQEIMSVRKKCHLEKISIGKNVSWKKCHQENKSEEKKWQEKMSVGKKVVQSMMLFCAIYIMNLCVDSNAHWGIFKKYTTTKQQNLSIIRKLFEKSTMYNFDICTKVVQRKCIPTTIGTYYSTILVLLLLLPYGMRIAENF